MKDGKKEGRKEGNIFTSSSGFSSSILWEYDFLL
jgi:hypothetical protein